jgi:uncharacterized protein
VSAKPRRTVPCPRCGQPSEFSSANPWRPFCSERCRIADLGAWASERYRIPAKPEDESAPKDQGAEE